jgi:serine/threonine protein kinase
MPEQISSYRLEGEIARGGMGIVYRGVHTVFDQVVAIKAIFPELTLNPELRERFMNEARIQHALRHPNIVQLLEFLIEDGKFYIVMEFIDGETLTQRLRSLGRPMPASEAVPIFQHTLEGLGFAHGHGVVHRDIKPSNIMLARDDEPKLTDFGIARALGSAKMTRTGTALGTPAYMSPEQIQGTKLDHRTDIYSMGITLYEMLTGRVPFERPKDSDSDFPILTAHINQTPEPPRHWVAEIPPHLDAAVMKALAKKPEDRFQTCAEFQEALTAPSPASTRVVAPAPPPPEMPRQSSIVSAPPVPSRSIRETRAGLPVSGRPAVANPMPGQPAEHLQDPFWDKIMRPARFVGKGVRPRFSLLSGGILVLLTLGLPFAYQGCGGAKTGLQFISGESGSIAILNLGGEWADRVFYALTLLLAASAVFLVLLGMAAPRKRPTLTLLCISGAISFILLSSAVLSPFQFMGYILITLIPSGYLEGVLNLFPVVLPCFGLLIFTLAARSRVVRSQKFAMALLVAGFVGCFLLLADGAYSLESPGGFMPSWGSHGLGLMVTNLFWILPAYIWARLGVFGSPGTAGEWLAVRRSILKFYMPCIVGVPLVLWMYHEHEWGLIPYTFGIHLISLGYLQLAKTPLEHGAQGP